MTTTATKLHYHFDQVGSYLRPDRLKKAREQFANGEIDKQALLVIQHEEIKKVVDEQVKAGLSAVTDGEFNRSWWHLDFLGQLGGFESYEQENSYKFHGANTRTTNVRLNGKVHANLTHPFFEDFTYLQSIVPTGVEVKQTIPSPTLVINRDHRSDLWSKYYVNWIDFLDDVAQAYHDTLQHFYDLGARYIQLDDTTWAYLITQLNANRDNLKEREKYEQIAEDNVYVINKALSGLPEDLKLSTHICRGNFKSTYLFEGSYEPVAKYLGQLNYDGFFLEYDDARSGDFKPLIDIWHNRQNVEIVLGLLTSKSADLEDEQTVISRIIAAQKYVPASNLALSTQCGFSSTEEGNVLTISDQWQKLALVKKIADEQLS
ncbi:vitamin B12 independent methionine synthase [Leuconostoc sp. MS02]|uniref:Vitamin B12 independent methionine synthase n=1 Tax=Leuconostoc aquikimchii TaxID=3236804 RepID=A0ABV3S4F1_9LACO